MRALVLSAAILAVSAMTAIAFPASFGLPHFVRVDQWPDANVFEPLTQMQARPRACRAIAPTDGRCRLPEAQK